MTTSIYYFTGTGNSLYVARKLAGILDADMLPIKEVIGRDSITPDADRVGIVFPVYNHLIPYIIKRFTDRLSDLGSKYIFAVCTYGDSPCIALEYLSGLLSARGGDLSCGFGIKMPYNYICPSQGISGLFKPFILREVPEDEQYQMFFNADQKLHAICEEIRTQRKGAITTEFKHLEHAVDLFNLREYLHKPIWLKVSGYKEKTDLPYLESIQLMDHGFYCDEHCINCGTCAKVCPVGNIKMDIGGPKWLHGCEQCFACLQWCPKSALQFGRGTAGRKRYHHPDIFLPDMLVNQNLSGKKEL